MGAPEPARYDRHRRSPGNECLSSVACSVHKRPPRSTNHHSNDGDTGDIIMNLLAFMMMSPVSPSFEWWFVERGGLLCTEQATLDKHSFPGLRRCRSYRAGSGAPIRKVGMGPYRPNG